VEYEITNNVYQLNYMRCSVALHDRGFRRIKITLQDNVHCAKCEVSLGPRRRHTTHHGGWHVGRQFRGQNNVKMRADIVAGSRPLRHAMMQGAWPILDCGKFLTVVVSLFGNMHAQFDCF